MTDALPPAASAFDLARPDAEEIVATAHAAAEVARVATLRYFRTDALEAASKSDAGFDPVTAGDRGAETAMRALIEARRPQDGILGEEFGTTPSRSGLTWVLDPIDGTRGYLAGTPTWGVLIGVLGANGPLYGIVDQPFIGERFSGGLGAAAYAGPHGTSTLATRPARALSDAVLFSTFPEIGTAAEAAAFARVAEGTRLVRYGMDCYAYALLALGQIDLVIEAGLHAYDIVAPIAVVEAAGGIVTDWTGGPAHGGGRVVAASCPDLHRAALDRLAWDGP